jgi:hypothetical protein
VIGKQCQIPHHPPNPLPMPQTLHNLGSINFHSFKNNSIQIQTNANANQQPQFFLLTDGGHYGNGAIPMHHQQMNGIGIGNHQQNVQQQKQQELIEPSEASEVIKGI